MSAEKSELGKRVTLSAQPTPEKTVLAFHFHDANLERVALFPNARNSLNKN